MKLIPLKSTRVKAGDNLISILKVALNQKKESLKEGDILVIASKVVAYSQGLLRKTETPEKLRLLIHEEADSVLAVGSIGEEGEMVITLKNKVLIPNAGIDSSNTPEGEVVLWPKKPFETSRELLLELKQLLKLNSLGIVISDSHCQPLRMGTSGIAIGWAGFEGVQDERGKKDLFGKKMTYTKIAVADNLASAANLLMGETDASIPFVIVRDLDVQFSDKQYCEEDYFIRPDECIYRGLYNQKLI